MDIPIIKYEAIVEASKNISHNSMDVSTEAEAKKWMDNMVELRDRFISRQPELATFIQGIISSHTELNKGNFDCLQFLVYIITIMDSLYIQFEVDDLTKLFSKGDRSKDDDYIKKSDILELLVDNGVLESEERIPDCEEEVIGGCFTCGYPEDECACADNELIDLINNYNL